MKNNSLAVIGVGNMAKAIINGILASDSNISEIVLFDINKEQYSSLSSEMIVCSDSVAEAVLRADCVLLSVKPQNYPEIMEQIKECDTFSEKLYISIGAGISTDAVRDSLGDVRVVRVLPNLPMLIGQGVSVICRNDMVSREDFDLVRSLFVSAGSVMEIEEKEMNRIIGVTSSSPAYVFKFIDAVYQGALRQGISSDGLIDAICDVLIGSALMVKNGDLTPSELAQRVASKGGTTERALATLDKYMFTESVIDAMIACTERADELGRSK